jgi:flagellar basal-body rod modification protein FlgD
MAISPIGSAAASSPFAVPSAAQTATEQAATDAFGLSFESLLKIILTQLTYQDPLKPMDNFEFVSQLAQFSQIQQTQTMSERLQTLVSAQATVQATSLLGRTVDIAAGTATLSGKVTAVSFQEGDVRITIETAQGQTIAGLSLTSVTQIREGN